MASLLVPHVLALFDLDHTLIETRGVGREMYERVFPAVTGTSFRKLATVSGRTELDIIRETLDLHGLEPTDATIRQLASALVAGYAAARDELRARGRALPGAKETLVTLAADPAIHQGVLTGNLREVARIKLQVFGLAEYLDLETSAYGDDHRERYELVAIAQRRAAERTGLTFDNEHTVLIGDTPKDVEAALAAGVRVIGVATGKFSVAELREAGATAVVPNLNNVAQLVSPYLPPSNDSKNSSSNRSPRSP
ncbi:HAD family hydrolase [Actinocrispum wychmicini]|uniref:Phosphoglycolate phosphatase-like HAD superfamily hydrolase n=1 Tax=Actinocrispum wychmicini TaxID=1213861 RepID=A0A4V2S621_9PSEU|nr:haloacid dehalogenase-like hydrolase [Actinocrispum wychmicini]TCO54360.1 phosphoglycolate phosphatase-like HAD superfamily hydrolase [Actinocrispum wychmicini]